MDTVSNAVITVISTHTPLAGRDSVCDQFHYIPTISTHTPLAGRDCGLVFVRGVHVISTHTPLAGRDLYRQPLLTASGNFYSHAPCGT